MQKSMTIITSGMKTPTKKLEFSQVLPRFQTLGLLFLRNTELYYKSKIFSADLSRLEIRDLDKANQVEIAAHLFCFFSSFGRNNMKSLQRQIRFNIINHWGLALTLKRGLTVFVL